jgi:DNA helicase HerA-like ATPase
LKRALPHEEHLPERAWCIIDEAHVICPAGYESSATRSVIEYVKRGRDAGLSLVLATQQPSAIDTRVLSQVDLTLVHRLTFDGDISAALARIPASLPDTFMFGTSEKDPRVLVRLLESGEAIIGDSQADRAFLGVVRPRVTAHGGAEPK